MRCLFRYGNGQYDLAVGFSPLGYGGDPGQLDLLQILGQIVEKRPHVGSLGFVLFFRQQAFDVLFRPGYAHALPGDLRDGGAFFLVNGIRIAVSKNGMAQRVGYEVETDIEHEVITGLMEEPYVEPSSPAPANFVPETNAKQRLEQLESLRTSGLITQEEYEEKREEIIARL